MEQEKIKVLIADDHKIIRVGLRGMLEKSPGVEIVGEAEDGNEVLEKLKDNVVDVVLMDIDMGRTSGIATTETIRKSYPDIKVIGLTMHEEQDYIIKMLEAGANGYLLKNAGSNEIMAALQAVVLGNSYYSQTVSATLLKALSNVRTKESPKSNKNIPLSDREVEVLQMIAREHSNKEIADKLFISIRTVDTHRRNILEKLQVKNTAGLVRYAIEKALI